MEPEASQFDVKQDEEQITKLQEISDLLLAAGYFRARLKGLSYFDKIVGGLTWCLEMCSVDIDVDFLFRENLNIGEKIGITEKIVDVLRFMKCPYPLQPHQIQGLDAVQIFPVVQWLVKRAMENRELRKEHLRSVAVLNYEKTFSSLKPKATRQQESGLQVIPRREYKKSSHYLPRREEEKVHSTLMEYGYFLRRAATSEAGVDQLEENAVPDEEQNLQKITETRAVTRCVSDILHQQAQQISKAIEDYDMRQAEREGESGLTFTLKKEKSLLDSRLRELIIAKESLLAEKNELEQQLDELKTASDELDRRKHELHSKENGENSSVISQLRTLVDQNEEIKKRIKTFKEECKITMAELQQRNSEIDGSVDEDDESALKERYDDLREKLQYLQKILSERNAEMSKLTRELDSVPGRIELNQYQRRFTELDSQIDAKQFEYKGYYLMYNALEDRKLYLTKELSLLTSIHDNFAQAMTSGRSKQEFAQQMENIIASVRQNKSRVEEQLNVQRHKRETFRDVLQDLLAEEKCYKDTLKAIAVERLKYEQLVSQLPS